ncbi:uncharacterized protein LOC135501998 [Lineus longissimus]|uniref:uncharacterized protein LOC135501998 n=1 Tax=Lineus longissimus TaxID=88925 RepID=UPI002B4D8D8F
MERGYAELFLAALFLLAAANHASASIRQNETCGTNLRLDCGNAPIFIITVSSTDRLTDNCRAGNVGTQKVTIDQVRQECEGKMECDIATNFSVEDMRHLAVHYYCGQSNDICSDVTIQAEKSTFNLLDQAGIAGPSRCSCEAAVPPGTVVSVKILAHNFRSPGTVLALKWRDDATFSIGPSTQVGTTPYKHNVTDKFKVDYKTESGNNELLFYYEADVPIKMICNNGSEIVLAPTRGPRPGTGSGSTQGEETSTSGLGKEEEGKLPIGVIVGIVLAVIIVAVLVFLIVFFVIKRRRNPPQSGQQNGSENGKDDVEAVYETLTKKKTESLEQNVGGGQGEPVSVKGGQDTAVNDGPDSKQGEEKRDSVELPKSPKRESIELPKTPRGTEEPGSGPKHTSFRVSDSDAGGDYSVIVEDESTDDSNDKKGFLGWFGKKFKTGAKRKESDLDKQEIVKSKREGSGGSERGQKGSSDVPEGDYDRLNKPLLTKPAEFMPKSPVSPTYDHVDPNTDSVKSNDSKFNYEDSTQSGEVGNVYEVFPHKILPSAKLAKAQRV